MQTIEALEVGARVNALIHGQPRLGTIMTVIHLGQTKAARFGPHHYIIQLDEPLAGAKPASETDLFELGWTMYGDARWVVAAVHAVRRVSLLERLALSARPDLN